MWIKQTRQPKTLKALMEDTFKPEEMGPGLKRGMVLKVYKALIKKLVGSSHFAEHIKGEKLTQFNYEHPTFYIEVRPGSPWKHELHGLRYQIKQAINNRLNCEFIKEVRIV